MLIDEDIRNCTDFKTIDIDIDDAMLDALITLSSEKLKKELMPCSLDIWHEKIAAIESIKDLHNLIGECEVNDQIVESIIAGIEAMGEIEPITYYNHGLKLP